MLLSSSLLTSTLISSLEKRNTLSDWIFYDVSNLSQDEFNWLSTEKITEGSILVVDPSTDKLGNKVRKHADHAAMVRAPGKLIQHFAIAGVGSSDVGAASLARTLANHLGQPVGAIVAGYGIQDMLLEALGGWFYFGAANRMQYWLNSFQQLLTPQKFEQILQRQILNNSYIAEVSKDTATILNLLSDDGREVKTLLGHSKGCLSIALALNHLSAADKIGTYAEIDIVTVGAVVKLPGEMTSVRQYLGAIDTFGGMNSILSEPYHKVSAAWHHLNTTYPFDLNLSEILKSPYEPSVPRQ